MQNCGAGTVWGGRGPAGMQGIEQQDLTLSAAKTVFKDKLFP